MKGWRRRRRRDISEGMKKQFSSLPQRTEPPLAVHLDPVGGVSGDMFVAAVLDARPDLIPACLQAIGAMRSATRAPAGASARVSAHGDGVLTGTRFEVAPDEMAAPPRHEHDHAYGGGNRHQHRHWIELHGDISRAEGVSNTVKNIALEVFELLAEAEAAVHGVAVGEVAFHEVGAWDSVADIIAAATLIDALGPAHWSVGPLPRGRGLVQTAHGALPIPAPAALHLLTGFELFDDGEMGERVTPTGAALLKWLRADQDPDPAPRRLVAVGAGFGARRLKGRSNVLRVSLYQGAVANPGMDLIEVMRFEVDDQTPEDLSVALQHLRAQPGVLDVCSWPVVGKKGRSAMAVQLMARPDDAEVVAAAVFHETTTLGVRRNQEWRSIAPRRMIEAGGVRVKWAERPSGATLKVELDDIAGISGWRAREQARRAAERAAEAEEDGE